jgi:hypothetical protein
MTMTGDEIVALCISEPELREGFSIIDRALAITDRAGS